MAHVTCLTHDNGCVRSGDCQRARLEQERDDAREVANRLLLLVVCEDIEFIFDTLTLLRHKHDWLKEGDDE